MSSSLRLNNLRKKPPSAVPQKPKKKLDRFDGLSEEDLQSCKLPDILKENLDMVFVGINPSLTAAYRGRYYAGPGNHFYKLLHASGLTPQLLSHEEDSKLLEYGIGLTNIVERPSRSSSDLKKSEIKVGAKKVEEKLILFKPKIAIFNGKGIYEVFSNKTGKSDFSFGLQPVGIGNTAIWVVPSSSARCAHFPRMVDKLHFYSALRKYLLHVNGKISDIDIREFSFEGKCKIFDPTTSKMWRRKEVSAFMHGGRVANKETLLNTSEASVSNMNSTNSTVKKMRVGRDSNETMECENLCVDDDKKSTKTSNIHDKPTDLDRRDISFQGEELHRDDGDQNESNFVSLSTPANIMEEKQEVDFVDLIKQRLSQRENSQHENSTVEVMEERSEIFHSIEQKTRVKKLRYSMLKKNRSNSLLSGEKSWVNDSHHSGT
ncbi:G/T mismatch-specific thymine DNA glycosylase-like [Neodiprion virginianus]|uniref:G/T mismatch-specific thymine DNA glycosylase-like n=1 Tax=Neodiprion virginianus TaxID=2961670 RepID=UPI001EE6AE33|nr:G/T mismatch-specific thymine DNA glycosylase-like [Neodiprion virginianus]